VGSSSRFVVLLFSSAIADVMIPIFSIFLPLFAVTLGANSLELGLVGGTSYAVYSFMPFVMGHFSDRRGSRKFFIITSLLILCIVSLLYAASNSAVSLIVVRVFEGVGWAMLWPAMEAAIVEDSSREPKSSLAIFNYVWSAGAALGPGLGTLLVTTSSYRTAFLASGALLVVPIILNGVIFLRERGAISQGSSGRAKPGSGERQTLSSSIRRVFSYGGERRSFAVWSSLTLNALVTATSAIFFTFFGPYATSIGLTLVLVGAATSAFGVVRFFTYVTLARQSLTQKLFDGRVRIRNLVVFACVASLSSLFFLIRDSTGAVYFLAFALFAIGNSAVYAMSQTTLIAETASEQRGAGAGLFESSIGVGGMIGPIAAGAVSSSSLSTAFAVPPVILALALGFIYIMSKVSHASTKRM
jgi:MFS family permease